MPRKPDPKKQALIKELGLEESKKNWSIKELEELKASREEKAKYSSKTEELVTVLAGPPPTREEDVVLPTEVVPDPLIGLTEKQRWIVRLYMRGLSQQAIATMLGVTQPFICAELKRIREWQAERGRNVDQQATVGQFLTVYDEISFRGWELYHDNDADASSKAKALAIVMQAAEKQAKLLTDVGLLRKAQQEVKHTLDVSPFMARWKSEDGKKQLGDAMVVRQLEELAEPTPDVEDAEIVEDLTEDDEE